MPAVYACIVPASPSVTSPACRRTLDALERVREELAGYNSETLLLLTPPGQPARSTIGVVTAGEVGVAAGGDERLTYRTDRDLAEAVLREAEPSAVPAQPVPRWGAGAQSAALGLLQISPAAVRVVAIEASRLEPRFHFELGRAAGRALTAYEPGVAIVCAAELSHALSVGDDAAGRVFDERYRRGIEAWDVKWLAHVDSDVRRRAREAAVAQTALLMGALSPYRIQPRVLSYEAPLGVGLLVASIDVLGERRRGGRATPDLAPEAEA